MNILLIGKGQRGAQDGKRLVRKAFYGALTYAHSLQAWAKLAEAGKTYDWVLLDMRADDDSLRKLLCNTCPMETNASETEPRIGGRSAEDYSSDTKDVPNEGMKGNDLTENCAGNVFEYHAPCTKNSE